MRAYLVLGAPLAVLCLSALALPVVARADGRPARDAVVDPGLRIDVPAGPPPTADVAPAFDLQTAPVGKPRHEISTNAIQLPQGAGKIRGMGESFSAQLSTGAASFSVPIALPDARGDVDPSLTLGYSSARGSALTGVGWSIDILFIARQTDRGAPRYQDGAAWHAAQDRFVFNGGQELVPICLVASDRCDGALAGEVMPSWAGGWQYFRPRAEGSFQRFFWSPDHRTWRVQSKTGASIELGVPLDDPGDTGALERDGARIFQWNVTRQYDEKGPFAPAGSATPKPVNAVRYRYALDGGVAYLTDIYDTPPTSVGFGATPPLSQYAHHTRLRYERRPDTSSSYRRGWRIERRFRLVGVDITSMGAAAGGRRELLRRYHLSYDAGYHVSLLTMVQMEGRCASSVAEDGADALPPVTGCPRLPGVTFEYEHVAGTRDIEGYEAFDETVRPLAGSPHLSLVGGQTELFDLDRDGLPDVVSTPPASQGHQVFFGQGDGFGPPVPIAIDSRFSADARVLAFGNPNVSQLDLDGDGQIDLFHAPMNLPASVYSAQKLGDVWTWAGRAAPTPRIARGPLDFGDPQIRVADVDGDGLVDVIESRATGYKTSFALGRFPGGDGVFGRGTWTSATTADLDPEPRVSCTPWSATPVLLSDADVHLADMNGDGLVDVVRARPGDVRYWPGRGDGTWGTSECAGGFATGADIAMGGPMLPGLSAADLRVKDVNGDGLDDLVRARAGAVDVWLNVDGASWTARHTINGTPIGSALGSLRFADVDGSGTLDLVFGEGRRYQYLDLAGGSRPWTLVKIANGLGATTEIEYSTSASMMVAASRAGRPWSSTMPMNAHVVSRVRVKDNLSVAGRPPNVQSTEYTYRDPVYDGRQREMRGFRSATTKVIGDTSAQTASITTEMLLGECQDEPAAGLPSACSPEGRWRDNPREALKGLPALVETLDEAGVYLSTAHEQHTLRKLYSGLDGRGVWHAYVSRKDEWRYDTAPFVAAPTGQAVSDVEGGPTRVITLRSAQRAQISRIRTIDAFGNPVSGTALGCVSGCAVADEPLTQRTDVTRVDEPSGWMFRETASWTYGADGVARKLAMMTYDAHGNLTVTRARLAGTLPLDRRHETGAAVAPAPPGASADGDIEVMRTSYDVFGQPTTVRSAGGRCVTSVFDAEYTQLVVAEFVHAGTIDPQTGCGDRLLGSGATYDRGLAAPVNMTAVDGARSRAVYDGFGRVVQLYRPDPMSGQPSSLPFATHEYLLTQDANQQPYSFVRSRSQDGPSGEVDSYVESWSVFDGNGRAIVALTQADPAAGDGGAWIANGLTEYDARGEVERKFLPWYWTGDPRQFPLSVPPATASTSEERDAFGRVVRRRGLDGAVVLFTQHHAISTDAWDAADLEPGGKHAGTYATTRQDGHARTVERVERLRVGGAMQEIHTVTRYLPTGEPREIRRTHAGHAPVVRWMLHDTLGRMVLNVEPSTTQGYVDVPPAGGIPSTLKAWRYAYDDLGDLVGTSDARGCGVNYHYDAAGRVLAEDYSPCRADHAPYTAPSLTTGDGTELYNRYDEADPDLGSIPGFAADPAAYRGRIASIADRAAKTVARVDRLGRSIGMARRLAPPGPPAAALAQRFTSRWYVSTARLDAADRVIENTTGAAVPELLRGGSSAIAIGYSKRSALRSVGGSYGPLLASVQRDADDRITRMELGDAARTTTSFTFDSRRRTKTSTTYRASAPLWSTATSTYPHPDAATTQLLLEDVDFTYDAADNPTVLRDFRVESEWPAGAKPVTKRMQYDDLYRLTRIDYDYSAGDDAWTSPYQAELEGTLDPRRAAPSPQVSFARRLRFQTFDYDWLGNVTRSTDDARGFYDRSLGTITNVGYQLRAATGDVSTHDGALSVSYDEAGYMKSLAVTRHGPCLPAGSACSQRFAYAWDEAGRLSRARRWDLAAPGAASDPLPDSPPAVELRYAYDGDANRILKTSVEATGDRHTIYALPSLELRRAAFTGGDYERTFFTEVPYLLVNGVRLARVHYAPDDVPRLQSGNQHVLLELTDHLGSSNTVVDQESGELVERSTYQAYGSPESDYRPERWGAFREDYRFTGKEEDIEVGLQYFVKRYYAPSLGRWMSADPLAVHVPGEADLNVYAYVHGRVLSNTDPLGLEDGDQRRPGESLGECKARRYRYWYSPGDSPAAERMIATELAERDCDANNDPFDNYSAGAAGAAAGIAAIACARAPTVCGKVLFVADMGQAGGHDEAAQRAMVAIVGNKVIKELGRAGKYIWSRIPWGSSPKPKPPSPRSSFSGPPPPAPHPGFTGGPGVIQRTPTSGRLQYDAPDPNVPILDDVVDVVHHGLYESKGLTLEEMWKIADDIQKHFPQASQFRFITCYGGMCGNNSQLLANVIAARQGRTVLVRLNDNLIFPHGDSVELPDLTIDTSTLPSPGQWGVVVGKHR